MARIRTIKPDYWTDEKIGSLKREERLMFIGLWNLADDQGVVKSNSSYIKGQLFSYDEDLRITSVNAWLASLTKARLLIPFTYKEEGYFLIRTFHEHQLINRPSKPKFPSDIIQSVLSNTHGVFSECSQPEKEIEGKGSSKGKEAAEPPDFEKKLELIHPFSEKFLDQWYTWKAYKKKEFKFLFKSIESEQEAINELINLSDKDESIAIQIIKKSMASGWKGFFKLKNNGADTKTSNGSKQTGAYQLYESIKQDFAARGKNHLGE